MFTTDCNEEFSHYEEKRTLVTCPSCSIEHCNTEVTVRGDVDNYAATSAICCSGIHHGVIVSLLCVQKFSLFYT